MTDILPDYFLKNMILFHCKRGASGCEKCKILKDEGAKFTILKATSDEFPVARPILVVELEDNTHYIEYEIIKSFTHRNNAIEFLKAQNIEFLEI